VTALEDLGVILGIVIAVAALVVALVTAVPYLRQRRIDRDPERHYRFEGPEHGWRDLGEVGKPQLNLAVWNNRSIPVDFVIQAMDVRKGAGGGGIHLYAQSITPGLAPSAAIAGNTLEIPSHGHRRLLISGRTPIPGYRGDIGVAVTDGDRRIFLVYHHCEDDPPPFPGSQERNAVPKGVFLSASGTFGESRVMTFGESGLEWSNPKDP
jgi:hypothetical protein